MEFLQQETTTLKALKCLSYPAKLTAYSPQNKSQTPGKKNES